MLKEKNIPAFTTWEKELPKFAFDPRYKCIPFTIIDLTGLVIPDVAVRKGIFETFVKNRLEDDRKEKKERYTSARDACKEFLDQNKITAKTSQDDFKRIMQANQHFKYLTTKEKEKLYTEIVEPMKKATKDSTLSR
jgi:transcription elongation regulator 1